MRIDQAGIARRRTRLDGTVEGGDNIADVEFDRAIDQAVYVSENWSDIDENTRGQFYGSEISEDGLSATALRGRVRIEGEGSDVVAEAFETLYAESATFQNMADDAFLKRWEILDVKIIMDGNSKASIGRAGAQIMYLNLSQAFQSIYGVIGLVAHESTHAFGQLRDGSDVGRVGKTQQYVATMMAEAGLGDGTVMPYGYDV